MDELGAPHVSNGGGSDFQGGGSSVSGGRGKETVAIVDQGSEYHHVLLPLTCKQFTMLDQSPDEASSYFFHGVLVSTVRLVGRMLKRADSPSEIRFVIHDGTGHIDARFWLNDADYPLAMHQAKDGDYIVVNGGLRTSCSEKYIEVYSVKCVTNFNDITHHFLLCVHVHLDLKKKAKARSLAIVVSKSEAAMPSQESSLSVASNGLSLFDNVLRVFEIPGTRRLENGVSFSLIRSLTGASESELRSVIGAHIVMGNMFSTVDDAHFKSSFNG